MSTHVWAYSRRTGRKRRIPVGWLTAFGDAWSETPRNQARKGQSVKTPSSPEAGTDAPANGDTTRKDQ